jgi:Peptidase S24-like
VTSARRGAPLHPARSARCDLAISSRTGGRRHPGSPARLAGRGHSPHLEVSGGPYPHALLSVLRQITDRVAAGETVTFRPTGNSMVPLIHSRDEVVVAPVDPKLVEVDDIVLTRVSGSIYIHLVKAVDDAKRRVLIGNNRGGTNGWTGFDRVYGIAVSIAGVDRPGAREKAAGG